MDPLARIALLLTLASMVRAGCTEGYEPFRLVYNLTVLDDGADALQCNSEGQVVMPVGCVDVRCFTNYTCTANDVIDKPRFRTCAVPAINDVRDYFNTRLCILRKSGTDEDHTCSITSHSSFLNLSLVAVQQATEFGGNDERGSKSTINFIPHIVNGVLKLPNDECYRTMYRYVMHFTTHVLGFDVTQLSSWRLPFDPSRKYATNKTHYPYGPVFPINDASVAVMVPNGSSLMNTTLIDGTHRVKLITPNVVAAARAHFGCDSIDGVFLEELGAAELHWERRIMNYELMSSEFNMAPSSPMSSISLAALVDTGWYRLSTGTTAEPYAWGRNWGCDFFKEECSAQTWRFWFCNASYGIAYDRSYVSVCGTTTLLPEYQVDVYQHFADDPTQGGWDPYADFCPYAGNLTVHSRCTTPRVSNEVSAAYSNITGRRTAAVYTTILNQSQVYPNRDPFAAVPRCMELLCLNASSMMFRAGDAFYPCSPYPQMSELTLPVVQGTTAHNAPFSSSAIPAFDFYGQIQCPDALVSCAPGSLLYGGGGFFTSSSYPALVSVEPLNASVAGGVTLTVKWSRGADYSGPMSCNGLLIGGQPTNFSTYESTGSSFIVGGRTFHTFTINTSAVLTAGALGGANEDGSGTVDVGLLCSIPDVMECGPQYLGMCLVTVWPQGFEYLSLPPPPAELGFLGSVTGQAIVALMGIIALFFLLVFASLIAGKFKRAEGSEADAPKLDEHLMNHDDEDGDVELGMVSSANATPPSEAVPSSPPVEAVQTASQPVPRERPPPPPPPPPPEEEESEDDAPPPPPPPPPPRDGAPSRPPLRQGRRSSTNKSGQKELAPPPPPEDDDPPPPPPEDEEITL